MSGDGRKKEISGIRVLCIFLAFLIIALLLAGVKMIFRTENQSSELPEKTVHGQRNQLL